MSISSNFVGRMCIVRTFSAGVFYGTITATEGKEVLIKNAVRLWQWAGAASLSQIAVEGVMKPKDCKFGMEVPEILVTEAIEILPLSDAALVSLKRVVPWKEKA